ncbi:hypothetical protein [Motilibacter aurantiacus]|uniref:hypothetical protein n=1 Tax=Motilibacter aurantiacus TaxID=2714955 RepID=UPI00140C6E1A|nr:hypothetical protein [Motilibacter aurantiacus]NHC47033.1 hypothetical protein [Motilibacter aurantiacus]
MRPTLPGRVVVPAVAVLALAIPSALQMPAAQGLLRSAGLKGAEEAFAELSFSDAELLPESVAATGSARFAFDVHNVSDKARGFTWQVYVGPEAGARPLASGRLELAAEGSAVVPVRVHVADCAQRNRVQVELTPDDGPGSRISYWVLPATDPAASTGGSATCGG